MRHGNWVGFFCRAFARLPLAAAHRIGGAIGLLADWLPNRNREVTRRNLELCFPGLSPAERRRLGRSSLMETGKTALETPILWCGGTERMLSLVREVSGEEAVRQARAEGRGLIVAAPHLGAWEVVGLYFGRHYGITSLYRPPRSKAVERVMSTGRSRTGATLVPTNAQGVRTLLRQVAKGEVVGILPDQDPGYKAGVFAPFFGIQTLTMTLLSKLAAKHRPLVVVVYAERLPGGAGFHLHIEPVEEAVYDPDPIVSATSLNRAVEQAVRSLPAQYQWSYKRFRNRPDEEPRLY